MEKIRWRWQEKVKLDSFDTNHRGRRVTSFNFDLMLLTEFSEIFPCISMLTLYQLGGGQKAPDDHKALCRFRRAGARLTKILDFVPFNTWQVPEKPFLKFVFENFAKLNVKNFRGSSSIRWKIEKSKKNLIFFKKSYFFWLNLYCTCSQLSFEVYNTSVAQNLKFRPFLTWKIWFLTFVIWQLVAAKVYYIEGSFWCL